MMGTPSAAPAASASTIYDAVRAGQRLRQVVAAISGSATEVAITYSADGATWPVLLGPAGMIGSNTSNWVEVIEL